MVASSLSFTKWQAQKPAKNLSLKIISLIYLNEYLLKDLYNRFELIQIQERLITGRDHRWRTPHQDGRYLHGLPFQG